MHKSVESLGKDAAQPGGYVWINEAVEMWITVAARSPASSRPFAAGAGRVLGLFADLTVSDHLAGARARPGADGAVLKQSDIK